MKSTFKDEWCAAMRALCAWERTTDIKFGDVSRDSEWKKNVVSSLESVGGIQSILMCLKAKIPLHGTSGEEVGIKDCHDLYDELGKCKAGNLPPPAVPPAGKSDAQQKGTATSQSDDGLATDMASAQMIEDLAVTAGENNVLRVLGGDAALPKGLSDSQFKMYQEAQEYFKNCHVCTDESQYKTIAQNFAKSGRCILVLDCRTSIKSVIAQELTNMATLATGAGHEKFRLLTFCGNRDKILSDT